MGYSRFLQPQENKTLPWLGTQRVFGPKAIYRLRETPDEFGWYEWRIIGRSVVCVDSTDPPDEWPTRSVVSGYLVGRAIVPDSSSANVINQAKNLHLIEDGLPRFCRVEAVRWFDAKLIYRQQDFALGPEDEVQEAYEDRLESVDHVAHVPPALDLAFRLETLHRHEVEERQRRVEAERRQRQAELEARIRRQAEHEAAELRREAERIRRERMGGNFDARAREAMVRAGAQLLDWTEFGRGMARVRYRFEGNRYECVCDIQTLQVSDAGFCLNGHDDLFTLESLPSVLNWVIHEHGGLHVTRRVG
jgi:hypothetical protein